MHKSVLPKDIKMSAATLAIPQYTYQQMRGGEWSQTPLELYQELNALGRTATGDCSIFHSSFAIFYEWLYEYS